MAVAEAGSINSFGTSSTSSNNLIQPIVFPLWRRAGAEGVVGATGWGALIASIVRGAMRCGVDPQVAHAPAPPP